MYTAFNGHSLIVSIACLKSQKRFQAPTIKTAELNNPKKHLENERVCKFSAKNSGKSHLTLVF
jgi:hypothetical protein